MNIKLIPIVSTILFATACTSTYTPTTSKEQATLTVPKIDNRWQFFGGFSGGDVMISTKNPDGCGELQKISKEKIGEQDITVQIPANQDIFIGAREAFGNLHCNVEGSFKPEAGKHYVLTFRTIANMCGIMIFDKDSNSGLKPVKLSKTYLSTWDGLKICSTREQMCKGKTLCLD